MYLLSRQTGFLGVWLPFFLGSPETLGALLHIDTRQPCAEKGNPGQRDQLPAMLMEIVLVLALSFEI